MAVDLNDNDSLNDKANDFWRKNKKNIIVSTVFFLVIYYLSHFYFSGQKNSLQLASEMYQKVIVETDTSKFNIYVNKLKEEFPKTPYASRASLIQAQNNLKMQEVTTALKNLDWAVLNSPESSIKSLALYFKSKVYLQQKEYDLAEKTANLITSDGFLGLKNYILGDIYLAKGLNEKALSFLNNALNYYTNKNDLAKVIKTKIDAISI